MKNLLIAIFILITTVVGSDHYPLNIHPRLELIGQTTFCEKVSDTSWICFDLRADKYCDVGSPLYVEYSDELGWMLGYLHGYTNECLEADHTTRYWEYRISRENVITEYSYHIDEDYDRILDLWHKGEVSPARAVRQREAIIDFTKNKWFDHSIN